MTVQTHPQLAIVVPVYNTAASVAVLTQRIHDAATACNTAYELVLVDDCSRDDSWRAIEQACDRWPRTRGIRLARNHGHHPALVVGVRATQAPWVFVLDCDLEDNPEVLQQVWPPRDYEVAFVRRSTPRPKNLRGFAGRLFYRIFNLLADHAIEAAIANQWLARRRDVLAVADASGNGVQLTVGLQTLPLRRHVITEPRGTRFEPGTTYTWRVLVREGVGALALYGSPAPRRLAVCGVALGGALALVQPALGIAAGLPWLAAALGLHVARRTMHARTITADIAATCPR